MNRNKLYMPKTLNYGDKFLSDKKSNSMTNSNSVLHKVREQLKKEKEQDRVKREKMLSDHINKRKIQMNKDYEDVKSRYSRETSRSADQ